MTALVDVLIPTYNRAAALAVTLTSLAYQSFKDFRLVISDQSDSGDAIQAGEVQAAIHVLRLRGHEIAIHKHLPPRGMAEQRQFLLDQSTSPYSLFLDDDLILEPYVIANMLAAIQEERCGFTGMAVIGLSYLDDVRPGEQRIEWFDGPVRPEIVRFGTPQWERYRLHNAANLFHIAQRLNLTPDRQRTYRVAWVGGCVLYDTGKLRSVGGFSFWKELPRKHCGEDVLAQLRVMRRYGGCGLIPSGVYHQELPTTLPDRNVDAPKVLDLIPPDQPLSERSTLFK
ncbi:MAG: glycosyltransferase family 2 protein [Chloroflexota bacterium]|nr:MAG: glycosyltransferase family 2 protein [Chloroflexota bacterium]